MARGYAGLVGVGNVKDERMRKYLAQIDAALKQAFIAIGAGVPPGQGTGGAGGGPVSISIEYVDEDDAVDSGTQGFLVFGRGDTDDLAHALEVDTTGRVNINPISGQTGVAAGAGASGVTTQRTITATDSPDVTALQIIDDWDESDRAKTNPIVGQAGVQAGAGAVSANTQRVVLSTDDPAVVSLAILDDWDESDRAKVNPIAGQAGVQGGSGTVSANTQRVVLATDVALPAGANAIGSVDTELPAAAALADNVANPTTPVVASYVHGRRQGGTTYDRVSNEVMDANTLGASDDRGLHVSDLVKYHRTAELDNVNTRYDDSPTSATSQTIDCSRFREFLLIFTLDSTLAPTDIQFKIQFSEDGGTTWFDYRNDFWGQLLFDDVACATAINRCYSGRCVGDDIRLQVVATGTTATAFFDVSNCRLVFKN